MTGHRARIIGLAVALVGLEACGGSGRDRPALDGALAEPGVAEARESPSLLALAEQGNHSARAILGEMYERGRGVPLDDAEAVRWARAVAAQGNAAAQFNIGSMYLSGQGVPQDDAEAVRWYRLAADQGNAFAQSSLGAMYLNGQGVPQDDAEAVRWSRLAADQGNAFAQSNLGAMYLNGKGDRQNDAEAARWFRAAADRGYASAQGNLGALYANGVGVPQDDVAAHTWFSLAAARSSDENRHTFATARDAVGERMSFEQLDEAQRRAREWKQGTLAGLYLDVPTKTEEPVHTAPSVPAEPIAQGPLTIVVRPRADCWVSLTVDGESVFSRVMRAGERESFDADDEIILTVGDAGAFAFAINQQEGRPLGAAGEVVTERITHQNYSSYAAL